MNVVDRILRWAVHQRGFTLGPALVDRADTYFGHEDSEFSPEEYGSYIATSNGVYACATLRAELLSSLPLIPYRLRKNGADRMKITSGPLYELLQKVNPFWTASRLLTMTELSLCLWGENYWFAERGDSGRMPPTELWWARPDRVRVVPDPETYIKGFLYYPSTGSEPIAFSPQETIWMRFPNPLDEFSGLAPLSAARVAADYGTSAMRSNVKLFEQGLQLGGLLQPKTGTQLTPEQSQELELLLDKRFKGQDKAHRWGVLRFEAQFNALGISPKDADFLGGLKWSLEDICRAFKVPLDLIGGQRTYENTDAAYRGIWTNCIIPEARFISTELTEQLLPMFVQQADLIDFDTDDVSVLQEAEAERWTRTKEQIAAGALTINEWRESENKPKLAWGDVWWAPSGVQPIDADVLDGLLNPPEPAPMPELPPAPEGGEEGEAELPPTEEETIAEEQASNATGAPERGRRAVIYGSDEHARLWRRFDRRAQAMEKRVGALVADLMERQRASILAKLGGRGAVRAPDNLAADPFDMPEWVKKFRSAFRPVLAGLVDDIGGDALDDLGLTISFNVSNPQVKRFIERRAQRFAQSVNQTTWDDLKTSLSAGIEKGESIPDLAKRVDHVMGARIRSSKTTIARTEVIGASNGGTLLAWQQSGVVASKEWLATLDQDTRDSHQDAHGQRRALDEDFDLAGGSGPAPGQIGAAEEDINCRCTMTAVLS